MHLFKGLTYRRLPWVFITLYLSNSFPHTNLHPYDILRTLSPGFLLSATIPVSDKSSFYYLSYSTTDPDHSFCLCCQIASNSTSCFSIVSVFFLIYGYNSASHIIQRKYSLRLFLRKASLYIQGRGRSAFPKPLLSDFAHNIWFCQDNVLLHICVFPDMLPYNQNHIFPILSVASMYSQVF